MKNTKRNELAIAGLESVKAASIVRPDKILRFFCTEERKNEFGKLFSLMAKLKHVYRIVSEDELEKLSGTTHHQGVVAMVENNPIAHVDDKQIALWKAKGASIVVLDNVGDDHNIGSIARSAAFFGWDAIVLGRDSAGARVTTSSYRVARGALERIPVFSDESAAAFIRHCGNEIITVAADHHSKVELSDFSRKPKQALALVLGNEETGLKPETVKACSHTVKIEGNGSVESLNVSQAAAVLLYILRK